MVLPDGENPIPLDVALGVTPHGTCVTTDGPYLGIYLENHPHFPDGHVTTLVFENLYSKEFSDNSECDINGLKFLVQSGKFSRIATTEMSNES